MTEKLMLLFSIDDAPRFGMALCEKDGLAEVIKENCWGSNLSDEDQATVADWAEQLLEAGHIDFEDGWLKLCVGTEAIAAELMRRVVEQYKETQFECNGAAEADKRALTAEAKLEQLQIALRLALGDKGPQIAAQAAA
jgi:hypothetical protein